MNVDAPSSSSSSAVVAEIIAIGDEMIGGARVDTNTAWIAAQLNELGCDVRFHSTVGDEMRDNLDVIRLAASRADVVVATGGLGPTADDLTREAIAAAAGVGMRLDRPSLDHIEQLFTRRGRTMAASNRQQAMIPEGGTAIFNPQGTAPGVDFAFPLAADKSVADKPNGDPSDATPRCVGGRIFALPGVPAEMQTMFDQHVRPLVVEMVGDRRVRRTAVMKFFGIGESDMEALLQDMIARQRHPRVGITVSSATIALRIVAMASTAFEADAMIESTRQEAIAKAGQYHFGDGEAFELQHAVAKILRQRSQRLAVIERGVAAPVMQWMAMMNDPAIFAGGVQRPRLSIDGGNASLAGVAASDHSTSIADADWTLHVDGYPPTDTPTGTSLPVAEVEFTMTDRSGTVVHRDRQSLAGHPSILHARIGKAALDLTRRHLQTEPTNTLPC